MSKDLKIRFSMLYFHLYITLLFLFSKISRMFVYNVIVLLFNWTCFYFFLKKTWMKKAFEIFNAKSKRAKPKKGKKKRNCNVMTIIKQDLQISTKFRNKIIIYDWNCCNGSNLVAIRWVWVHQLYWVWIRI